MNFQRLFFVFFCLLMVHVSMATAPTPAQQLQKRLTAIRSMKAQFEEKIMNHKGRILQQSQGTLYLQKPGRFRWMTREPLHQIIVANPKKLMIFDVDLEQITIRDLAKQPPGSPARLLTGSLEELTQQFTVKMLAASASFTRFRLRPTSADSHFDTIELVFNHEKLVQMRLEDRLGQRTLLTFHHVILNPRLPEQLFTLTPPKGIDVIVES